MDPYDLWKTTPPEPKESKCICSMCKDELIPDDDYYELDDEIYCESCAKEWLEEHRSYVTEDMAYGV